MIPARYGASRFPGKLMQDLGGKPVIQRTYEATKETGLFDEVYVVTDSEVIFKEIELNGGNAIMSLKEHDCGTDRIAEAVENMDVDIVVNVQGDEPFTSKSGLEQVLSVFNGPDAEKIDLASLMTEMYDWKEISDPNAVKVIVDKDNFALYFSRSPIPYPRDKNAAVQYFKHKGIYAFRKQALLDFYRLPMRSMEAAEKIECIRYLEYGKNIKMAISNTQGIEIDTPEDLVRANKVLKEDKVIFKISQINNQTYLFLRSKKMQEELYNNPFSEPMNVISNIQGGLGIWCGYGALYYDLTIQDSIVVYNNIKPDITDIFLIE